MSSQPSSSSGLPPSMGPGARPVQPGESSPGRNLMEMMKIRSKYSVHVDEESLSLGYELDNIPRHKRLAFEAISIGTFKRWLLYGGSQRAYTSGSPYAVLKIWPDGRRRRRRRKRLRFMPRNEHHIGCGDRQLVCLLEQR
jgi:hypothetical protein